jgi:DNA-directed RNA polymerase subunit beta
MEDFVDEDTGEVVSIERNEVVLERDTIIAESNIDTIMESGVKKHLRSQRAANCRLLYHLQYPE